MVKDNSQKPSSIKRILAYLIDRIIILFPLLVFVLGGYIFNANYWYGLDYLYIGTYYILSKLLGLIYFLFKDALFDGRSIGKYLFNLKVVDETKKDCSLMKSFVRNFLFVIPFFAIIELFFILFNKKGIRIGDMIAKTIVKDSSKKRTSEKRRLSSLIFLIIILGVLIITGLIFMYIGDNSFDEKYDNLIFLSPESELSNELMEESMSIIMFRLQSYDYQIPKAYVDGQQIVMRISDNLVTNKHILEEDVISTLGFKAKIGEQVVFEGGKDIDYVCRMAECSGIDPQVGCGQTSEDTWDCRFRFSISLSLESAQILADTTESLSTVVEGYDTYLNESLDLFLDDQLVDTLRIGAELKGNVITDIAISGGGFGTNQQEATYDALNNMKRLQTILMSSALPSKFVINEIKSS